MTGKYFLDTNFLIYCFSKDEPDKQAKCLQILRQAGDQVRFVLSTQVLNEFAAVMLSKFKQPPLAVKGILEDLAMFEVVTVDLPLTQDAIDIQVLYQLSYWDSLVVSGAKSANCHTLLTEDMQHDGKIAGVQIQNPFL